MTTLASDDQDRELRVWALTRVGMEREKAEQQIDYSLTHDLIPPLTADERERLIAVREKADAPPRDRFPHTPDHRLRSVVTFTLPSSGERWHWPVAHGDGAAIDALCEVLDRAGAPWKMTHG